MLLFIILYIKLYTLSIYNIDVFLFEKTFSLFVVYDAGNFEGAQLAEAYICWGLPRHLQTQVWGEDWTAWSCTEGEWVVTSS